MVRRRAGTALAAAALLLTAACSDPGTGTSAGRSADGGGGGGGKDERLRIAFFGFAKVNSFAQATFAGIKEYARGHNAEAEFLDPNFDAQTQVRQMQDAITSKRFDVFLVQANDGAAVQPQVRAALKAGITVVTVFTPIGPRFDTAEPQVPGTVSVVDVPVDNGRVLGEMGLDACRSKAGGDGGDGGGDADSCQVAYLEGFRSLPLDNARTKAVEKALAKGGPEVELAAKVEGGYTQQSGRKAMQDILQTVPDVDVVIGSSQAIAGAQKVASGKGIAFVGNGGSRQAVKAVRDGKWFATYYLSPKRMGAKAAEFGLEKERGGKVPATTVATDLALKGAKGTRSTLKGVEGEYDE